MGGKSNIKELWTEMTKFVFLAKIKLKNHRKVYDQGYLHWKTEIIRRKVEERWTTNNYAKQYRLSIDWVIYNFH